MPYDIKKVKGGYKVFSPTSSKSKKPMSKAKARQQQKAIYANTKYEQAVK
jgi:hypothetical protein